MSFIPNPVSALNARSSPGRSGSLCLLTPELMSPTRITCLLVLSGPRRQLLGLGLADRRVAERLQVGVDEAELLAPQRGLDRRPAAIDRDRDEPADGRLVARLEVALAGLAELHLAAPLDEDHVAHREPRVEVGAERGQRAGAGGVRAVDVDRQLGVELLLDDDDPVLGAHLPERVAEDREEVLLDLGGRLRGRDRADRRRAAVGRRLLAPQRDLLKPDEVGLRSLDLARERECTVGEPGALHLVPDDARAVDRLRDPGCVDRRREVGAEEDVAGHDRDLGGAALGFGHRRHRQCGERGHGGADPGLGMNRQGLQGTASFIRVHQGNVPI